VSAVDQHAVYNVVMSVRMNSHVLLVPAGCSRKWMQQLQSWSSSRQQQPRL
jgi:hypothetical protein